MRTSRSLVRRQGSPPALWLAFTLIIPVAVLFGDDRAPKPFIEVRQGTLPLILTVPHGGTLRPDAIRTRTFGRLSQDSNTVEIAEMLSQELQRRHRGLPHLVVCRLHRMKIDCNRDLAEAAQGDSLAIGAWRRFHAAAESMRAEIADHHGAGLLLDIHGHRHEDARVELGYLINGTQLSLSNAAIDSDPELVKEASIRELVARSPHPFAALLRGPESLGALLEDRGFPAVPSPSKPAPGDAAYYSGVYNVMAHGSRDGGTVSAIQVECPWTGVRDTPANQQRFAKALAQALDTYFKVHFKMDLSAVATPGATALPSSSGQ